MEKTQKKQKVSDLVYEQLKQRIISGEWKPGDRIPTENELCRMTGASRVSVRTAIQRLSGMGILESRQGGGTYVCELSEEDRLNSVIPYIALSQPDRMSMFEFRRIIEVEGTYLAAQRADDAQIAAMYETNRKMMEAQELEEITRYDVEYHHLLMKASANPMLVKVFEVLWDTYFVVFREHVTYLGTSGAKYHDMITHAIEQHDPPLARHLMEEHLTKTMENLAKVTGEKTNFDA